MLRRLRQELSEILELPLDVSLDLPKVTIVGDLGVLIQNHRGLIQYSPEKIVIGVGKGQIAILGRSLQIEEVSKEDMIVRGSLGSVQMET
ncbi:MAG: YabP/YqfC family sporulation protein [Bacillota bacterium]